MAFPKQQEFINDPARLKALFCTRRAAKSYSGGIYLIKEALEHPGCNCLFIGLTRLSAHGIVWKDILKEIDLKYKLGIRFNETLLTATFPNGSIIHVAGADSDESEMNKLLGKKYRLVVLDEASMFSVNMHQLVYGILKPATADMRGTICVLGTASNITRGLFYDITTKKEPGWSLHEWGASQNPHIATQWAEELGDIDKNRPLFKDTALYKQWYLNKWVIDEDALCYRFNKDNNTIDHIPRDLDNYHYLLGIDLGYSPDPSAFVVGCYHEHDHRLFIVHAEKHLKMDVTDVAHKISELDKKYSFEVKVIDGSHRMAVEELNIRHKSNVIPADKTGKVDFIRLMNDDFIQRKIQLLPKTNELADEYQSLVWETDNGKIKEPRKEHSSLPNHLTDAALYMWRYAYSYLSKALPKEKKVDWHSQDSWEPAHLAQLAEQARREQNPNNMELSWQEEKDLFDLDQDDQI